MRFKVHKQLILICFSLLLIALPNFCNSETVTDPTYHLYAMEFSLPANYNAIQQDDQTITSDAFTISLHAGAGIPPSFYELQGDQSIREMNLSIWSSYNEARIYDEKADFYGTCFYDEKKSCYKAEFIHYPYVLEVIFVTNYPIEAYIISNELYNSLIWNEEAAKAAPVLIFDEYRITLPDGWVPYEIENDHITLSISKDMICTIRRQSTYNELKKDVLDYGFHCTYIINSKSNKESNYSYHGLYTCRDPHPEDGYEYVYFMHGSHLVQVYFTYIDEESTNNAIDLLMNNIYCIEPYNDSTTYKANYFIYDIPNTFQQIENLQNETFTLSFIDNASTSIRIREEIYEDDKAAYAHFINLVNNEGKQDNIEIINGIQVFTQMNPSEEYKTITTLVQGPWISEIQITGNNKTVCEYYNERLKYGTYIPNVKNDTAISP